MEKADVIQKLIFFTSEITLFEICMLFHQYFLYFINLYIIKSLIVSTVDFVLFGSPGKFL